MSPGASPISRSMVSLSDESDRNSSCIMLFITTQYNFIFPMSLGFIFSLLKEPNMKLMLCQEKSDDNMIDSLRGTPFNVVPTLLEIGQRPNVTLEVRRHIVRAIDNLVSNGMIILNTRLSTSGFKYNCFPSDEYLL